MAEVSRRQYLLAAIQTDGRPVTTSLAAQLMADSPWASTGRNTARKDLRGLTRAGLLTATDGPRRTYQLTTQHTGNS
ncbi:hypothetical protein ACFWR9_09080 [Streptomyces sp. NPDC058534]|uniref:hypothetical protein n=1 Tax=Streptomyces sp. NPDC058534 TaxID=3346541 RepID=UPI003653E76A